MTRSAMSAMVYGIYALGAGLMFMFTPNFALGMYMMPPAADHWLLVVSILTLGLSYYYFTAARSNNIGFFQMSWKGRCWFAFAVTVSVVLGKAPLGLMGAALTDFILAMYTVWALRKDGEAL